jgi:predicted ATP-dependent endonuclease of OLD family
MKNNPEGQKIDLRSMSSGEIQILTSLLSLASVVKDNSMILIDEPEISLHPNWQMQYIDLLNKIFKSSRSCHFIIATHSHLLASDIPIESSAILSLKRDLKLDLVSELLDSTYGLSAENILYNVFGVASVRNFYFESDINRLLDLISNKSKSKNEIQKLITKFRKFKIHSNDPLSVIIKDAENYLKKARI